ncbi:hypothetical protein ACP6L2_14075 [Sphingobacterium lactis]
MKIITRSITERQESHPLCPYCKGAYLYARVHRPWWVKTFLFYIPLKAYKCNNCNKISYVKIKS